MPNALATGTPPPAPMPDQGNGLQPGTPSQAPGAPQGAAQPPAPSHEQTVCALRHFHAVIGEAQTLLKDPAMGKSDLKSKIIDGVTKLVSERMLSPAQAVQQLSQVPTDPLEQRKWLQGVLAQAVTSANAVVDHHAAGNPGTLDWATESTAQHPHADHHLDLMAQLGAQYGGR
jgi:hypothetical protein